MKNKLHEVPKDYGINFELYFESVGEYGIRKLINMSRRLAAEQQRLTQFALLLVMFRVIHSSIK